MRQESPSFHHPPFTGQGTTGATPGHTTRKWQRGSEASVQLQNTHSQPAPVARLRAVTRAPHPTEETEAKRIHARA